MADIDHLQELFAPVGGVSFKRMFSGYGIMKDGMMFALIASDVLYFRADDAAVERHKAEGAPQWTPHMRGKTMTTMPYWQVPERLFDEPEEFAEWARAAFAAAKSNKAAKAPKDKRASAAKPKTAAKKRAGVAKTGKAKPSSATKSSKPKRASKAAPKRR
jgi:DNA transformation protein